MFDAHYYTILLLQNYLLQFLQKGHNDLILVEYANNNQTTFSSKI